MALESESLKTVLAVYLTYCGTLRTNIKDYLLAFTFYVEMFTSFFKFMRKFVEENEA